MRRTDHPSQPRRTTVCVAALALILTLTLGGCDWFTPFERLCEKRLAPTAIKVEGEAVDYRTDFSQSTGQLTARGAASSGRMVLGLTQTNLSSAVSISANGISQRTSGRTCVRPTVNVKLAFKPMTVYVSREHAEGSCAHRITMDHEMKHVAAYRIFLADAVERVERELRTEFGQRIHYFDNAEQADKYVQNTVRDYLAPFVDASMREVEAVQARVDTPEEYFRLDSFQTTCARLP